MTKRRYFLHSIFLYAYIIIGIVFLELNASLVPMTSYGTDQTLFYVLAGVLLIVGVLFLILDGKKNGKLIDKILIPVLLGLLIIVCVTVFLQTDQTFTNQYTVTATFTVYDKANYIIRTFFGLFMVYVVGYSFWKNRSNFRFMHVFYYAAIVMCIFLIVVSLCIEFPKYQRIFGFGSSEEPFKTICSLFTNENMYGAVLVVGIFSLGLVRTCKKHWIQIVLFFIFFIELYLTSFLTGIIVATLFILFYFLYNVFRNMKTKFLSNLLLFSFSLLGCLLLLAGIYVCYIFKAPPFYNIADFFFKQIINKNFETFSNRTFIWQNIIELCSDNPFHLILGRGPSQGMYLLQSLMASKVGASVSGVFQAHNSVMEILLSFGLVGVACYAFLTIYGIYSCIYMIRHGQKKFGAIYLAIQIGLLIYGIAEISTCFKFAVGALMFTLLFNMPPIFFRKRNCAKRQIDVLNDKIYAYREVKHKFSLSTLFVFIFFGVLCAAIGMTLSFKTYDTYLDLYYMIMGIALSAAFLLFVPTLFKLFELGSFKRLVFRSIFYSILILGCAATPVILYNFKIVDRSTLIWMPVSAFSAISIIIILIYSFVYKYNSLKSIFTELKVLKGYPLVTGLITLIISLGGNVALTFINFPYSIWASYAVVGGAFGVYAFMLLVPNKFNCSLYLNQVNKGLLKFDITEHYIEKYGFDYVKRN